MTAKHLIAVVGPTGIGKTALAIQLAQHYNTEILSSDSRQFYKEMAIGTAVPAVAELESVPHHFIQHKSIHQPYSVGDFERDALQLLKKIFRKHDVAILVGGSGLFTDAVANGLDNFPDIDPKLRERLNDQWKKEGLEKLLDALQQKDPEHFKIIDKNNPHRILRALEVCLATGKPYSSFLKQKRAPRPFNTQYVGLTADRELIYDRIDKRVDIMLKKGLLDEVQKLQPHKKLNALQTVGYKEVFAYFEGKKSLADTVEEIKKNTRRFAKRQLTWYRKHQAILWVQYNEPFTAIVQKLNDKLNLDG